MNNFIEFNKISFRNFLSFGNNITEIILNDSKIQTIIGENLDNGGSNGSGKTTIINALCYAIYNKPFDNISLKNLCNNINANKDVSMEVWLDFSKNGNTYSIHRSRGQHTFTLFSKNGEDITPGKSVTETDTMIENIIGTSYELFVLSHIISGNSIQFLSLPIASQRQIFEELFVINLLSERAQTLKKSIKRTESDLTVSKALYSQKMQMLQQLEKSLLEINKKHKAWEISKQQQLQTLQDEYNTLNEIDFERQEQIINDKQKLQDDVKPILLEIKTIENSLFTLESKINDLNKIIVKLDSGHCPFCDQKYASKNKISENLVSLEKLLNQQDEYISKLVSLKNSSKEYLSKIDSLITIFSSKNELIGFKHKRDVFNLKYQEIFNSNNPFSKTIETIELQINDLKPEIDPEIINELTERLEHQNFLLSLLTNKNSFLRKKIINTNLPLLNIRINYYSQILGLPHKIAFNADMSCEVSEFNKILDFGNLSAGEKKRCNLALLFAFRDMLNHIHYKSNLLFLDEIDGQLDENGLRLVMSILREKVDDSTNIFIISHNQIINENINDRLIVQKQYGFSSIVKN